MRALVPTRVFNKALDPNPTCNDHQPARPASRQPPRTPPRVTGLMPEAAGQRRVTRADVLKMWLGGLHCCTAPSRPDLPLAGRRAPTRRPSRFFLVLLCCGVESCSYPSQEGAISARRIAHPAWQADGGQSLPSRVRVRLELVQQVTGGPRQTQGAGTFMHITALRGSRHRCARVGVRLAGESGAADRTKRGSPAVARGAWRLARPPASEG